MKWILGINPCVDGMNYHDPAACLALDGEIVVAAEEERFSRVKSAPGTFPTRAIRACLEHASLSRDKIAVVAVPFQPENTQQRWPVELAALASAELSAVDSQEWMSRILGDQDFFSNDTTPADALQSRLEIAARPQLHFTSHHESHAAAAAFGSGLSEALVVVVDGIGEIDCTSVWSYRSQTLSRVRSELFPNSLGYVYAAVTAFLGFKPFEHEGKTMALAGYGQSEPHFENAMSTLIRIANKGYDCTDFVSGAIGPQLMLDTDRACLRLEALLGVERRLPQEPIRPLHAQIARALQRRLELAVQDLVLAGQRATGLRSVAIAGGVALNCRLNQHLRQMPSVSQLHASPIASDCGLAIGAALAIGARLTAARPQNPIPTLRLGPLATEGVVQVAQEHGVALTYDPHAPDTAAREVARGGIVFWYAGRSEIGPRALGARSIVADPRSAAVARRVNEIIKARENWRPFGPSILAEYVGDILLGYEKLAGQADMSQTFELSKAWRTRLHGVVHSGDGTTRPHVVHRDLQPAYWSLIQNFHKYTGIPLVLNTSLNSREEPLVETFHECLNLFKRTDADMLIAEGQFIVRRAHLPPPL